MASENPENPIDGNQPTDNSDSKAADHSQETKSPAPPLTAQANAQPCCKHPEITCNTKRDCIDWITLGLEGFGLFILILYTVSTIAIWCANKKAAEAAKTAAEAASSAAQTAKDALADSQKAFVINERPYMVTDGGAPQFVNPLAINVPVQANVTIKNIGKTPALKILWNVRLVKHRGGPKTPKGYAEFKVFINSAFDDLHKENAIGRKEGAEKGAEQDLAPSATMFTTTQNAINLSANELADLQISKITLFYVGVISYTDSFGTSYETQFCAFYFGVDPRIWHICDNHNTIQ